MTNIFKDTLNSLEVSKLANVTSINGIITIKQALTAMSYLQDHLPELEALVEAGKDATGGEWGHEYKNLPNSKMYAGQIFDEKQQNITVLSWHPVETSCGIATDRHQNGDFIIKAANARLILKTLIESLSDEF